MNNPVSLELAKTLHTARQLTKFYLKHADGLDLEKRFTINGFETNSIHWIVAHLTWAEDMLILDSVGNQGLKLNWFRNFTFGSTHPEREAFPNYTETLETFDKVHKMSLNIINNLSAEELEKPNHLNLKFGESSAKGFIIQHCIRHEGMHCGHLSWLLRMHGVKRII